MQTKGKRVVTAEADAALVEQIDAIAAAWKRERPGVSVSRSDVIRVLLLQGLRTLNAAA